MFRRSRQDWFTSRSTAQSVRRQATQRLLTRHRSLRFEPLEDRRLLSITVNTLVDENDGIAVGGVSLRDAIAAATPGETIDFAVTGTITLAHGELPINKSLTIAGPGAKLLTIDAQGASRVFFVNDNDSGSLVDVSLRDMTVANGLTPDDGGGIWSSENLSILRSLVRDNQADDGGGLANFGGKFSIVDSTFSGNRSTDTSDGGGGGIFNFSQVVGQISRISNSTFSNNATSNNAGASFSRFGGGVYNFLGTLEVEFSTFTSNESLAGRGSGIATLGDPNNAITRVYSTIVAGNVNSDVDYVVGTVGSFQSLGYNLIGTGNAASLFVASGDVSNVANPMLGPLADNGGPTPTHEPLDGSPAIDAGDFNAMAGVNGVPEFDQRGTPFGRVSDGDLDAQARIDIGAVEKAATIIVDTLFDENDGVGVGHGTSFREAIAMALSLGGSPFILFDDSLTAGGPVSIDLSLGQLSIESSLTIVGPGADLLTIDGQGNSRVFAVDDGNNGNSIVVMISGLTLAGGNDPNGGGAIFSQEKLTVADSVVSGNSAQWGGGIYNAEFGELTVIRTRISGNHAVEPTPGSVGSGGGLYNWGGQATVRDSVITGNDSISDAGGLRNANGGYMYLVDSTVSDNSAADTGGGLRNDDGYVRIVRSMITGNDAGATGGGIHNEAVTVLLDAKVSNNSAPDGGGINNAFIGSLTVESSTISGNMAVGGDSFNGGGGIRNNGGPVDIISSTLSGNTAGYGGGLYIDDSVYVQTRIINSTISSNTAATGGGGIFNYRGHLIITFSTVADNMSPVDQGSGIASWADQSITLSEFYSTIVVRNFDLDSNPGTDVDLVGGPLIPENSIQSINYNLIGGGSATGSFDQDHDAIVTVAEIALGPLADNGGPTWTHALLPGSVAIDAGDPFAAAGFGGVPLFDQRGEGFDRVRDGDAAEGIAIDIGAFEVQEFVNAPALPGDYNLDEVVDAADYTVWRDTLGTHVDPYSGADGDGDGMIDPDDYGVWKSHFGQVLNQMLGGGSAELAPAVESPAPVTKVFASLPPSLPTTERAPHLAAYRRVRYQIANRDADLLAAWIASRSDRPSADGISAGPRDAASDAIDPEPIATDETMDAVFADWATAI